MYEIRVLLSLNKVLLGSQMPSNVDAYTKKLELIEPFLNGVMSVREIFLARLELGLIAQKTFMAPAGVQANEPHSLDLRLVLLPENILCTVVAYRGEGPMCEVFLDALLPGELCMPCMLVEEHQVMSFVASHEKKMEVFSRTRSFFLIIMKELKRDSI